MPPAPPEPPQEVHYVTDDAGVVHIVNRRHPAVAAASSIGPGRYRFATEAEIGEFFQLRGLDRPPEAKATQL